MNKITCARVGYGTVARLHEKKLREIGVKTIAVIEANDQKRQQALEDGYSVFDSCAEAAKLNPHFWDICVNTSQHFAVIQTIIRLDPHANIIVEKPLCLTPQIHDLNEILKNFSGRITINENYASSVVIDLVKDIVFQKLNISPNKIIVEFTKNRQLDSVGGRFIDYDLGVLGYEGSHMLDIISQLGDEYLPVKVLNAEVFEPACTISSDRNHPQDYHKVQGSAYLECQSRSGTNVEIYTSMVGNIRYTYPIFSISNISPQDMQSRYRVIAVYGTDLSGDKYIITGFFEPINGLNRSEGAVATIKNGKLIEVISPIKDDCMGIHLKRTVNYFTDNGENPYPIDQAIKITELLNMLSREVQCKENLA